MLKQKQQQLTVVPSYCIFTDTSEYVGYLAGDVLAEGVKTGKYTQGFLQVNKSNATQEAFLRRAK